MRNDWKYLYWPDFDHEELFHLADDSLEEHNLVKDTAYSEQLENMRKRFAELRAEAK